MELGISLMGVIMIIVHHSSGGGKTRLNFQWSTTSATKIIYSREGVPLVTEDTKDLFQGVRFRFYPNFYVLDRTEERERSFHITLDDPTMIFLHLYGKDHPVNDNYRIRVTPDSHPVVEKCDKWDNCHENLLEYNRFFRLTNESLSRNIVFISWKYTSEKLLLILVQYKNYTIECRDRSDFQIEKLVINGTQQQEGFLKNYFQHKVESPVINGSSQSFTLNDNGVVYVQSLQCMFCVTRYYLKCDPNDFSDAVLVNGLDTIKTSENGMISSDWTEVIVPRSSDKKVAPSGDCRLEIVARLSEDIEKKQNTLVPFLNIAESVANILLIRNNKAYTPFCAFERINNMWRWKKTFDLKYEDEILIETLQYSTDPKYFQLNCRNFNETLNIDGSIESFTAMNFGKMTPTWLQLYLPRKSKFNKILENCSITFHKNGRTDENCPDEKVWKIERDKNDACFFEKIFDKWRWRKKFDLSDTDQLLIEVLPCFTGETILNLVCDNNFNETITISMAESCSQREKFYLPTEATRLSNCDFSVRTIDGTNDLCPDVKISKITNRKNGSQFCIFQKNGNSWKWKESSFDLNEGDELFIEISQCSNCESRFDIECRDNFSDSLTVKGSNQSLEERYSRNTCPTWLQFLFPTKSKPEDGLFQCSLSLKNREIDEICPNVKVWKIQKSLHHITDQKSNNNVEHKCEKTEGLNTVPLVITLFVSSLSLVLILLSLFYYWRCGNCGRYQSVQEETPRRTEEEHELSNL